ncbi:TetR/AcrR family transcriptional regulator C-terminal domain-containing protein [Streptomyces sp. NPDC006645]|uniref:TetR/AcrR family transcriptional regulator C-terminal domain-containing protein n=1 Tax=unclassified Streptomyces TaxID=2593676 RepID=UPI0033BE655D
MWLRESRAAREQPPLTRARIVDEAVALLDEAGIDGLTMRRLAERIGSGVTTLYWHVDTKDDVVDLALDAILGELPPADGGAGLEWRAAIVALLVDWRTTMLRHPWSAALLQRPTLGPNLLARMEFLQATLARAGFTGAHLHAATWTLYNYLMGATVARASFELSEEDRETAQRRLRDRSAEYPTLSANQYMLEDDWDGTFVTGLGYALDGIAAAATRDAPSPGIA